MNAIQKKLIMDKYCKRGCISFQYRRNLYIYGCRIEAIRNHYVNDINDFVFCQTVLDEISNKSGTTEI